MTDTELSKKLDRITSEAKAALGDNLRSLVLYGSHVRGEAHAKSDINLFIVVRDSHAVNIKPLLAVVPGWLKLSASAPVIFESSQLERSGDTFALELAEMASTHRVLFGDDPFADFSPDWKEVRNELEHESRQKTIYLKRRWLSTGGKDKAYLPMLRETVPGYLALLRGAALLKRRSVDPLSLDEVFKDLTGLTWFSPNIWNKLRAVGNHHEKIPRAELLPLILEYIEQARAMVRYFDSLPDE